MNNDNTQSVSIAQLTNCCCHSKHSIVMNSIHGVHGVSTEEEGQVFGLGKFLD